MRPMKLLCLLLVLMLVAGGCKKEPTEEPQQSGAGIGRKAETTGEKAEYTKTDKALTQAQTVTVDVTNSNGSISQVTLRRQGVGYIGPRGEYYDHLPTGEELKPIYGF